MRQKLKCQYVTTSFMISDYYNILSLIFFSQSVFENISSILLLFNC